MSSAEFSPDLQNPLEKAAADIIADCLAHHTRYHPTGVQLEFGDGAQKSKAIWMVQVRLESGQFIPTITNLSSFKETSSRYEFLDASHIKKSGAKELTDKGEVVWAAASRLMRASSEDDVGELETIRDIVAIIHSRLS